MREFLEERRSVVLKWFKEATKHTTNPTTSVYRKALYDIGLNFDISLLSDIQSRFNKNTGSSECGGDFIFFSLVSLFTEHLFVKRIDKDPLNALCDLDTNMLHFNKIFKNEKGLDLSLTKRQYTAGVTFFYRVRPLLLNNDPFLEITRPIKGVNSKKGGEKKRSDIISFLLRRRMQIKQVYFALKTEKPISSEVNKETVEAFVEIFNRCLEMYNNDVKEDEMHNLSREIKNLPKPHYI